MSFGLIMGVFIQKRVIFDKVHCKKDIIIRGKSGSLRWQQSTFKEHTLLI